MSWVSKASPIVIGGTGSANKNLGSGIAGAQQINSLGWKGDHSRLIGRNATYGHYCACGSANHSLCGGIGCDGQLMSTKGIGGIVVVGGYSADGVVNLMLADIKMIGRTVRSLSLIHI